MGFITLDFEYAMKIHEYQAKKLLDDYGIITPRGCVAESPSEARDIAERLGGKVVVKAQVHAGGRGKAGGVRLVNTATEAEQVATALIGSHLVTHQTGSSGVVVRRVLLTEQVPIQKELYVAIVVNAESASPMIMASTEGGVEIEDVAERSPEKILRVAGHPLIGLSPYRARAIALELGLAGNQTRKGADLLVRLYQLFVEKDCTLAEINPLVVTPNGSVIALDAKLDIEDDALFRHPDLKEMADREQQDQLELRAADAGLSYVKLEGGRVGCMVNGAGLAMATMDITKAAGAEPANFLDVGGSATEQRIEEAFSIIVSDPDVQVVFINLFGGILRTDAAARGIVKAARNSGSQVPIVTLMRGTGSVEGRETLAESGVDVRLIDELSEAPEVIMATLKKDKNQ